MTTLALPALLTHAQAFNCVQSLGQGIRAEASDEVIIDASALEKFDSSALAVLLQCRRDAATSGKNFVVTGLPHQLSELADLYGISELLEKHQVKASK
jgi:phospholipid transport system transporter-binding protein